jgi:hypothetical protein
MIASSCEILYVCIDMIDQHFFQRLSVSSIGCIFHLLWQQIYATSQVLRTLGEGIYEASRFYHEAKFMFGNLQL